MTSFRTTRRRGNAAIEFALSATLLLMLIFGLMEWGWTLYRWFGVQRASQAGARMAAVTDTESDPTVAATAAAQEALREFGIDPVNATVSTTLSGEPGMQTVTVRVDLAEGPLVGLVPAPEQTVAIASQHYE